MKTSKIEILGFILFFSSTLAYAQPKERPNDRRKEIEAHKVAYITTELQLSSEEAQAFWPVYNECQANQRAMRKASKNKQERKGADGSVTRISIDDMTDDEVESMVDNQIIFQQKELDMKKECLALYREVLPIKKVAKLYHAERKFRKQLLKRIQGGKVQKMQAPRD